MRGHAPSAQNFRPARAARNAKGLFPQPPVEATMSRMPWPQYFMHIARMVSERTTCARRRVGAIAVLNKRILATGYNGAPAGMADCLETGCLRQAMGIPSGQRHELCRGLHAEQNIIIQAAVHGISLAGAEVYATLQPCIICTKMLINCGIAAVYYLEPYPDELAETMLDEAGIPCSRLSTAEAFPLPADARELLP